MPRACARSDTGSSSARMSSCLLEAANDGMADYLREHTTKLLNDVLYTSSNLMHNSFAMSDRWAE